VIRRGRGRAPEPPASSADVPCSPAAPGPQDHGAAGAGTAPDDRGAAAVELALVLPLLLVLLFGIVDFGRMLNAQIVLTEAAREGARAAAMGYNPAARITRAAGTTTVTRSTVTSCPGGDTRADAVVVLTHRFTAITPMGPLVRMLGGTADDAVTITARGVMPCVG
jgi:Flp pilus assembly protein TadG